MTGRRPIYRTLCTGPDGTWPESFGSTQEVGDEGNVQVIRFTRLGAAATKLFLRMVVASP